MRRLAIGLLTILAGLLILDLPSRAQGGADDDASSTGGDIHVLQVSGLFDPILIEEVDLAIDRSATDGAQALILQINSRGTVVSDDKIGTLIVKVAESPVPVGVWVGPTGARFYGTATQLLSVADVTGMAPGARVGYTGSPLTPDEIQPGFSDGAQDALVRGSLGLSEARDLAVFTEISDEGVPTITSMVQVLDGRTVTVGRGNDAVETELETTQFVVLDGDQGRNDITAVVTFFKLSLLDQLFHTVASPAVAYLLLLSGLVLLVFEFFTAGVGVAGAVGALCLILACTGLAVIPIRPWALVAIVMAMFAFAVDVQVGLPRFWTGVGLFLASLGSWFLYENLPGATLRPSWITLIAGVGGIALTFIVGMPNMVRTRFATPTIGREWMIGAEGVVVNTVDPDGTVAVGEGTWIARTNRATPVQAGDPIRVTSIDGITLEVEPLTGAAEDYRKRRRGETEERDDATTP